MGRRVRRDNNAGAAGLRGGSTGGSGALGRGPGPVLLLGPLLVPASPLVLLADCSLSLAKM